MHQENQSLVKLRSIARFLNLSNEFLFQNYNLQLFLNFLQNEAEIAVIINHLVSKYSTLDSKLTSNRPDNTRINAIRNEFHSFDENVAFCIFYIKKLLTIYKGEVNLAIKDFPGVASDDSSLNQKWFYNACIEPILIYIELQIKHSVNALYILRRYKILCEWYEADDLLKTKKETDMTKKHLSKFLFDSGFTYPLVEVVLASGRVDSFPISIDSIDKKGLPTLPQAIIVEAKIHSRGNPQSAFKQVFAQASKRMNDLNFKEAFCIIFNKAKIDIGIDNAKDTDGFFCKTNSNSRIYFLIINLLKVKSTDSPPIKRVDLGLL